jgi:hypothetical protein
MVRTFRESVCLVTIAARQRAGSSSPAAVRPSRAVPPPAQKEVPNMRKNTKKALLVGAAAVATVGVGATAWAAAGWTVTGGGTVNASTSAIKPLHADVTVAGNIYPGSTGEAVALVDNPNDFPVLLDGITPGKFKATKKTGGDNPQCTATLTAATITTTLPDVAPKIAARAVDQQLLLPISVSPDLDAACAGSTITMYYTLAGTGTV